MKKILLILSLFPILVFSQKSYKIPADSTILNNIGSGKNELVIRNATSNITGGILTNLGNGVTAFVLGAGSGVSQTTLNDSILAVRSIRKVDTLYRNLDSIIFTINGTRYAFLDSVGVNDDLFRNGKVTITASRNFLASDAGKIIILNGDSISLTMPIGVVFPEGTNIGVYVVQGKVGCNVELYPSYKVEPLVTSTSSELMYLRSDINTGQSTMGIISSLPILDVTNKTALKYLFDKVATRKVDTSYTFRNSTLDSLCQITVINGISYRSCGKDSVGAGSSTLALDKITDAVDSSTLNAGNYTQEWKWNGLSASTGLKLSSTGVGVVNSTQKLFECTMSGVLPATGSSSYAGYFRNAQTGVGSTGLYVEGGGGGAIFANGSINITSGSLQLGGTLGALFYRNSGATFLQAATGEQLLLVSQQSSVGNINFLCSGAPTDVGFQIAKKTINQHYIFGLGGARYNGNYVSASSTSACIMERNANKIIFSANSGLPGGGTAIYVPNNILTINGGATEATSNVGIGTTTPVASAKLEVSSTTSGFLPPRMTATQASAISSPAQGLLLFVTDTDGTFTSVGWWGYNGATWEKLNN